jgi:homotetrameric cytidine deaminase
MTQNHPPILLPENEAKMMLSEATAALAYSHAPVSGFRVGAALLAADGEIVRGCNVESPSVLQVFCAERVALLKALSEGLREFTHLAVVAEQRDPVQPCGLCRQMLMEFAPDLIVITRLADGSPRQIPLADYLPESFRL